MQLVYPLASGIVGAANGSVLIYQRGTTVLVTYYANFDGTGPVSPTGAVALDANGGGIFYVNQLVDCIVKDSNGNVIRTFAAGSNAPDIEVVSQSFTGTDYQTGAQAASKPTTLQAILDLWKTNSGAIDWKVLAGGSTKTLSSWISGSPNFFNVKDGAYGAKGDGPTDDTSAINSAITACSAAGGGTVFFPQGTYRITSTLNLPDKVDLIGASAGGVTIRMDHATNNTITLTAVSTSWQVIRGFWFLPLQTNTGKIITSAAAANFLNVEDCRFGDGVSNAQFQGTGISSTANGATIIRVAGCSFAPSIAAARAVNFTLGLPILVGNRFTPFNATGGFDVFCADGLCAIGNRFENANLTGINVHLNMDLFLGSEMCALLGNTFTGTGATAVTPWRISGNGSGFAEAGNSIGSGHLWTSGQYVNVTAAASNHDGASSPTRETRRGYQISVAAALTVPADVYGEYEIETGGNQAMTLTIADPPSPGMLFTLAFYNNEGVGSGTITIAGNVKGLASFTVNANNVSYYTFRSVERGTSKYWILINSTVNQAP